MCRQVDFLISHAWSLEREMYFRIFESFFVCVQKIFIDEMRTQIASEAFDFTGILWKHLIFWLRGGSLFYKEQNRIKSFWRQRNSSLISTFDIHAIGFSQKFDLKLIGLINWGGFWAFNFQRSKVNFLNRFKRTNKWQNFPRIPEYNFPETLHFYKYFL